jgi:hypothetical protein
VNQPSPALAAAMCQASGSVPPDKLDALRDMARQLRDKEAEIGNLDERLKDAKAQALEIRTKKLVDLMAEVGVDKVGLPAEGNYPACDAELKPYYHAVISADWEPERRQAAFAWLDSAGHGDLIKTAITILIGRDERDRAKEVEAWLASRQIDHTTQLDVPWNTLTAFVKEQVEKYHSTPPLETLGATVGQIVKLKARKT